MSRYQNNAYNGGNNLNLHLNSKWNWLEALANIYGMRKLGQKIMQIPLKIKKNYGEDKIKSPKIQRVLKNLKQKKYEQAREYKYGHYWKYCIQYAFEKQ